jgi:hypothetical protein
LRALREVGGSQGLGSQASEDGRGVEFGAAKKKQRMWKQHVQPLVALLLCCCRCRLPEHRNQDSRFRVVGLEFRVQGLGFRV